MKQTQSVRAQLQRAEAALADLDNAENLAATEEAWRHFLWQLDRLWNKAEAHFSASPKWPAWNGRFSRIRKSDALLKYLSQARNSDEHTVEEIAVQRPGALSINAIDREKPLRLKSLRVDERGRVFVDGMKNGRLEVTTPRLELLPVTSRGVTYPVPTTHLGSPIDSSHPVALATLGLRFYSDFVDLRCPSLFGFQPAALMPPLVADRLAC